MRLLPVLLAAFMALSAAEFYVAPGGSSTGDGSIGAPWDLTTALSHPPELRPGDVIWLRGGIYEGTFTSQIKGTVDRPVIIRQVPSERVIIDGNRQTLLPAVLTIRGEYTWFWGLEVTNSNPVRVFESTEEGRATGIDIFGSGTRLINCVIHDNGNGIGFWSNSRDSMIYGAIVYNNGWDSVDRGHGHAVYAQNEIGSKRIVDSVFFNSFSHGLHIYGSDDSFLNYFSIEGNIAFDNGILSRTGITRNILLGGGAVAKDNVLTDNYTYFSPSEQTGQNNLGYRAGCDGAVVKRNYFANGGLVLVNCANYLIEDNTFHPYVFGFPIEQMPSNTYLRGRPTGSRVFVRANQYESGRAHVAIFNWDLAEAVSVDLSGILRPGDLFQVRDLQNVFGEPLVSGIYAGRPIQIPMGSTAVASPGGQTVVPARHTSAEFGSYLVLPYCFADRSRSDGLRRGIRIPRVRRPF